MIIAIYLLGREQNNRPAQCLVRETPFFHSGISPVKIWQPGPEIVGD